MDKLSKLAQDLGVQSFEKLTNNQMTEILQRHAEGQISIAELQQIAAMVPHFSQLAIETARSIVSVAATAGESQKAAFAELAKTRDAIVALSSHPKADAEVLKLIIEKLAEMGAHFARMNESNNSFWNNVIKGVVAVATIGISVLALGTSANARR